MIHSIVNNTAPEYLTSRFVRRCDLTSYNPTVDYLIREIALMPEEIFLEISLMTLPSNISVDVIT